MELKINKIKVLVIYGGPDICHVHIDNDIPEGIWPFENNLTLKFETAKGQGVKYCKKYFPDVPVEEIKTYNDS